MEIGRSFSFITEDPRWQQKLMIGTGVLIASFVFSIVLIGLVGFLIVMGYGVRLLQNVRDGQATPLPEWDQWGEDFARGLKLLVVVLVWSLPALIFAIPYGIGVAMTGSNDDAANAIGGLLLTCGACLSFLYGLFVALVTPGFSIAFARDEQITSGLQFRDIWAWTQNNIGQILIVVLIYIAASIAISLVAGIVGAVLCLVGLIITIPLGTLVTYLIQYHMYGQLAQSYPFGGSGTTAVYTPPMTSPSEMEPGMVSPEVQSGTTSTTGSVASGSSTSSEYPDSGIDNPPPPPPKA